MYLCRMKTMLRTYLSILFISICMWADAALTWKHIEGMPCEETYAITEDSHHFMWFGTRLGLIRYDGYQMQIHRNDTDNPHAFSSCDIRSLASDENGMIYAGTFFGVNNFNTLTQHTTSRHFHPNDFVGAIITDSDNNLWVGTGCGLYIIKKGHLQVRSIPSLHDAHIIDLIQIKDNSVIILTERHGIYITHAKTLRCSYIEGSKEIQPLSIAQGNKGDIWIGTRHNGLYSLKGLHLSPTGMLKGINIEATLYSNRRKSLIIGTEQGIYVQTTDSVPALTLPGLQINNLYEDTRGNLWASAIGRGIWFCSNETQMFHTTTYGFCQRTTPIMAQFAITNSNDTLPLGKHKNINSVYADTQGYTFIGTQHDGIYIYRSGTLTHNLTKSNTPWLKTNECYAFIPIDSEHVVMTSWNGLYLFNPRTLQGKNIIRIGCSDISNMHTLSGSLTHDHTLWLGLVGGIAQIRFKGHNLEEGSLTLYTHLDKPGITNPHDVSQLTDQHADEGNYQLGGIYRIVQDSHRRLWACTSEPGLLRLDKQHDCFSSVSHKMGIDGDNVHSLDIDNNGYLWFTTNYGILQLSLDAKDRIRYRRLYTRQDGLPTNYYGSTISSRLSDGTVCFVNQDYFITTRSSRRTAQVPLSHVYITDMQVDGISHLPHKTWSDKESTHTKPVTLSHRQNNLTISFSALAYGNEQTIRYAYQLVGIDHCFRYTKNGQCHIYYSQLPPGTYTLRYGVADPSLQHPLHIQEISIHILQPLWWCWWARIIYAFIFIVIGLLIIHYVRERNHKRHQMEILEIEKQNINTQYQKMTQFYTRVIHDFLTPVTLISDLAHQLQQQVRPTLQATVFMLSSQTDKLLEAMSNTRDVKDDASIKEAMAQAREMTQTDKEFLRRCTESVNRHISDESYSHQTMMNEVGASHATLYRKLKALTGMDATSFIRSIRLRAACQILSEEPTIRIGELALRVGYSNPKYFSTCFKKDFGMSPKEYQEQFV